MASVTRDHSQTEEKILDDFPDLKNLLPPEYDYYLENYEECESHDGKKGFTANFRIGKSTATKEGVREWIKNFDNQSMTTYRIDRTYPNESTWYVYRLDLRCHRNTKPFSHKRVQTPHKKHIACPAKLIVKIRQAKLSRRKKHKTWLETHPVEVILYHHHNHLIQEDSSLKFRDPDANLVKKFHRMYQAGYKPSAALEIHKRDLHIEHGDSFSSVVGDRGVCPDVNWCYRQFGVSHKKNIREDCSDFQIQNLHQFVYDYNAKCGQKCAALKVLNDLDGNIVVALLSPLMRIVHSELESSAKVMLIDSVQIEYLRCRMYMMITRDASCSMPLGVLIVTSDSAPVLQEALNLYKELVPDCGFGGKGLCGPSVIMLEDDDIQHSVMSNTFPSASLFLSPYHIIQKAWRYLCESQKDFTHGSELELFEIFKESLLSDNEEDFEKSFEKLNLLTAEYSCPKFSSYMETLYSKKHEWTACLRKDLALISRDFMEFIRNCVDFSQERFLYRNRSCLMTELLVFLTKELENFYEQKLCKYTGKGFANVMSMYFESDKIVSDTLEIVPYFKVKNVSSGLCFNVDMKLGFCSCSAGIDGSVCQHQYIVMQNLNLCSVFKNQNQRKASNDLEKIAKNLIQRKEKVDDSRSDQNLDFGVSDRCVEIGENQARKDLGISDSVSNGEENFHIVGEHSNCNLASYETKRDLQDPVESFSSFDSNEHCINETLPDSKTSSLNECYPCHICGKVMSSHILLKRHQKLHNHNKSIVCDVCGLGYRSKASLKNHITRNHSLRKHFECETCGRNFQSLRSITQHKKEHLLKEKCLYCNDIFSSQVTLRNHMNRVHEDKIPNIILEMKNTDMSSSSMQRQDIKEIIIIDTGQLPFQA